MPRSSMVEAVTTWCLLLLAVVLLIEATGDHLEELSGSGSDRNQFCSKETCGGTKITLDQNNAIIFDFSDGSRPLRINTAHTLQGEASSDCADGREGFHLCRDWARYVRVEVWEVAGKGGLECRQISWIPSSRDFSPVDCISMADAYWYGGAEFHTQRWPINDIDIPMQPFVSEDLYIRQTSYGNVLEPFWVNSNGLGIMVSDYSALHVSINEGRSNDICFKADFAPRYFPWNTRNSIEYTICKGKDVVDVVRSMSRMAFRPPIGIPDFRMIKHPVWSTWARYKTLINQSKVLEYAREIKHFEFPNSQLQIDDMYTTTYGDFDFDHNKFPDPSAMITELKGMDYRVTAWVHPFANLGSEAFLEGLDKGYWMMDSSGEVPALVRWWQGVGAILDTTNPAATDWFVHRLEIMQQEYGIDSFKFDAGEMTYLPSSYKTHTALKNPGYYTKAFVDTVSRFGDMIEVRCGYKSQNHQIFVRMADKDSKWGYDNGLKAMIPATLTMGLLGYPYILPDMIGGNGYGEVITTDVVLPARELYIRWLQLTAYLPAMQFSFVPWDYDGEVVRIALRMVQIHEEVVTPILLKAAEETQISGAPLIRPLWWITPEDPDALTCDSEFLVGDSLLVAPILENGKRQRDIYIPKGTWKDNLTGETLTGSKWLTAYQIDLKDIATFTRIHE